MTTRMREAYKTDLKDWIDTRELEINGCIDLIVAKADTLRFFHNHNMDSSLIDSCVKGIYEECSKVFEHKDAIERYKTLLDSLEKVDTYVAPSHREHLKGVLD